MDRKELEDAVKYLDSVESDLVDLIDEVQEMEVMISKFWNKCRDMSELLKTTKSIIEWELNK